MKCHFCRRRTGINLIFKCCKDMIFEYIGPEIHPTRRAMNERLVYLHEYDFSNTFSFLKKICTGIQSFTVFMNDDWCVMHFVNKVIIPLDLYAIKLISYIRRKFMIDTLMNTVEATVEVVLKNLFGYEILNELTSAISLTSVLNKAVVYFMF